MIVVQNTKSPFATTTTFVTGDRTKIGQALEKTWKETKRTNSGIPLKERDKKVKNYFLVC